MNNHPRKFCRGQRRSFRLRLWAFFVSLNVAVVSSGASFSFADETTAPSGGTAATPSTIGEFGNTNSTSMGAGGSGSGSPIAGFGQNAAPPSNEALNPDEARPETTDPRKQVARTQDPCQQQEGMSKDALKQRETYCAAAKAAEKAIKGQKMAGAVHGVVAGVCATACAANFWSFGISEVTLGRYCSVASIGAAVGDVVLTKNFMGAAGALTGALGLMGAKKGAEVALENATKKLTEKAVAKGVEKGAADTAAKAGAKTAASKGGNGGSMVSCLSTAVEAAQSFMSFSGAKDSKKTAEENRAKAAELVDGALAVPNAASGQIAAVTGSMATAGGMPGSGIGSASTNNGSGVGSNSGSTGPVSTSDSCSSNTLNAQIDCATKSGGFGPGVRSPEFQKVAENLSGLPFQKLLSMDSPKSIMGAVTAKGLGAEGSAAFGRAIDQFEAALKLTPMGGAPGAAFAGGGGGGRAGGGEDPTAAALNGLLGNLGQKGEGGEGPAGATSTNFRSVASSGDSSNAGMEEDRSVSLFDRVSRRYLAARDRLVQLGYSTQQNRSLSR